MLEIWFTEEWQMKQVVMQISGLAALLAASAVQADDLSATATIFGHDPGGAAAHACFSRHYTAAHLAKHPHQNVTAMLAFIDKPAGEGENGSYTVGLDVKFRKSQNPFQVSGSCSDGSDIGSALACGIECDGGSIGVRVKSRDAVLIDIPDGARIWDPDSEDEPPATARFGADDKVFRLERTDIKTCLPLVWDDEVKKAILSGK